MRVVHRWAAAAAAVGLAMVALPASAQFYIKSRDLSGGPIDGDEVGITQSLPGATATERRANLVWTMRAALNVAALQCNFEPTLLAVPNYNAILADHKAELAESWDTLGKYFARVNGKSKLAGSNALDHYQTVTYSAFSTVSAQRNFCQTANEIGRDAVFQRRGQFAVIAQARMRELHNSLTPWGEQAFPRYLYADRSVLPRLDPICWDKKGEWVTKKCGAQNWPPAGTGFAAR